MILVSGGSGLVGSYLLKSLISKGEKVRAIYRSQKSLDKTRLLFDAFEEPDYFDKIEWVKSDILDLSALELAFEEVKKVYHCAAVVSFQEKNSSQMMNVNIEGTANMVNLSLKYQIGKFCYVSSVAALGKYRDGSCTDEDTIWQKEEFTSDYSISKFYAENEVWRAAEEGLDVVIVNPSTIIGFGDWMESSNALFKKVNDGLPFYPPGVNGFVAVEDVVSAMIQLMESSISKERFVISAENLSYQDLFAFIAKGLDKKPPTVRLKKWQAKLYSYWEYFRFLFSKKSPTVTSATIKTAFSNRCFSNNKIKGTINLSFSTIEEASIRSGKLYSKLH